MDWFKSVQKQAQEAAEKLMQTEAAAKALAMAQQAGQQAKVFAEQAKVCRPCATCNQLQTTVLSPL